MVKKLFPLGIVFILVILALSACGYDEETDESGIKLYYINSQGTKLQNMEYQVQNENLDLAVYEILEAMRGNFDDGVSAIPNSVTVTGNSISGEVLTIGFNAAYSSMDNATEVLMRAAVVLTLTQLDDISSVQFNVNGQPLTFSNGTVVGTMKASDFVDQVGNTINNYESKTFTLYFSNYQGNALKTEVKTAMVDSSKPYEQFIIEQLMAGPSKEGDYRTIPDGTEILSIHTNNGICYVDFNEALGKSTTSVKDDILIYSIVNSLTELSYINKVQISVDGEIEVELHGRTSLNELFIRNLSFMEK